MPNGIPLIGDVIKPPTAMEILKTQATALTLKDMIRERKIQQRVATGIQEEKELDLKRQRVFQEAQEDLTTIPETVEKPGVRAIAAQTRLEPFEKRMKSLGQSRTAVDIEKDIRRQEGDIAGARGIETQQKKQALEVVQTGLKFAKAGQTDLANTLLQGNSRQILSAMPELAIDGEIPLLTGVQDAGDYQIIQTTKGFMRVHKGTGESEFIRQPAGEGAPEGEVAKPASSEKIFEATKRTEEISLGKFKKPYRELDQKQKAAVLEARERSITQGLTTSLRKEFIQLEEVKQFKGLKPQFLKMEALGKKFIKNPNVNRSFIDQGLIVIFNKMLDPGSVVRESEFARTPEFIPLVNRMEAFLPKLIQGGAGMTDRDRLQLIDDARTLFDVHADEFNRAIDERTALAEEAGVRPKLAVPAKKFERQKFQEGQTATNAQGEKVIFRDGKWQPL